MKITVLAILLMMLAYFLILYGAVGFIQDKRFFGSAPKENLAAIPDKKERFRGAHLIGWLIEAIAILLFAGAALLVVWDGVRNGFRFWNYFVRFLVMLYCLEIYDILFFDWVLLCHSNFFRSSITYSFHPTAAVFLCILAVLIVRQRGNAGQPGHNSHGSRVRILLHTAAAPYIIASTTAVIISRASHLIGMRESKSGSKSSHLQVSGKTAG